MHKQNLNNMYLSNGYFLGLVVIATAKHPIPSRTRPLRAVTPMVLRLKTWESRSPPNLKRDTSLINDDKIPDRNAKPSGTDAGWSSPVARQAHNLKAAGSNPAPATKKLQYIRYLEPDLNSRVLCVAFHVNAMSTF